MLLVRRLDVADAVAPVVECIIYIKHSAAGIAEYGIHALLDERLDEELSSCHLLHVLALLPACLADMNYLPSLARAVWIMRLIALT